MTADQKKTIYNFLKLAETSLYGYSTGNFEKDPDFTATNNAASTVINIEENSNFSENSAENQTAAPVPTVSPVSVSPSALPEPATVFETFETLESLKTRISSCQNCVLCQKRINTVPGEGVKNPLVLVIGEGPGEDEDKTGRPFVGRAGQLLDKMLNAISLNRTRNCYIANIVKCRPPMNRTPLPEEAAACSEYLNSQIQILKPKMILCMGRTAVQNLLHTQEGINRLRGKILNLNGIPVLATYHPSALLRNEALKAPAWNDLKIFRQNLLKIAPDYEKK